MECAVHGTVEAKTCGGCKKELCDACAEWTLLGKVWCESCVEADLDRRSALGSALVPIIGAGYLATLALGVQILHAKPFVGGIAAIVAIALGRTLQVFVQPRFEARRESASVDAEGSAR